MRGTILVVNNWGPTEHLILIGFGLGLFSLKNSCLTCRCTCGPFGNIIELTIDTILGGGRGTYRAIPGISTQAVPMEVPIWMQPFKLFQPESNSLLCEKTDLLCGKTTPHILFATNVPEIELRTVISQCITRSRYPPTPTKHKTAVDTFLSFFPSWFNFKKHTLEPSNLITLVLLIILRQANYNYTCMVGRNTGEN